MREILFRGKDIFSGEWEYGGYVSTENEVFLIYNQTHSIDLEPHTVEKRTVGQYTGLTDKNGKKIFIDDIVEAKRPPLFQRGVVTQLSDGLYVFEGKKYHDIIDFKLEDVNLERCLSVIGNIHDNPELLEVGE